MKYPHNYIGTQIMYKTKRRTLLGDVKDAYNYGDSIKLVVKHFNGEPWPFDPNAGDITILSRHLKGA